jgi:hypothetical protein
MPNPISPFVLGQRVTYYQALHGRWAFEQAIPAIVVSVGKRIKIAVLRASGRLVYLHVGPERMGRALPQGYKIFKAIEAQIKSEEPKT